MSMGATTLLGIVGQAVHVADAEWTEPYGSSSVPAPLPLAITGSAWMMVCGTCRVSQDGKNFVISGKTGRRQSREGFFNCGILARERSSFLFVMERVSHFQLLNVWHPKMAACFHRIL